MVVCDMNNVNMNYSRVELLFQLNLQLFDDHGDPRPSV